MKRDMSLIRALLLYLEVKEEHFASMEISLPGYDSEQIAYHLTLMIEAGLIDVGDKINNTGIPIYLIKSLTWEGHDLLDAIRKPRVWHKVLDKAKEAGISLTFSIMKDLASKIIKESLGL